jgi:hypothetical protein
MLIDPMLKTGPVLAPRKSPSRLTALMAARVGFDGSAARLAGSTWRMLISRLLASTLALFIIPLTRRPGVGQAGEGADGVMTGPSA